MRRRTEMERERWRRVRWSMLSSRWIRLGRLRPSLLFPIPSRLLPLSLHPLHSWSQTPLKKKNMSARRWSVLSSRWIWLGRLRPSLLFPIPSSPSPLPLPLPLPPPPFNCWPQTASPHPHPYLPALPPPANPRPSDSAWRSADSRCSSRTRI
ncbi:hypothetical protein FPV67DRAFT_1530376 [Lyophyllum atratum]|nr:hypothetical protein FPV67DRAFT_1530376 [Lyophyllum atratum]